MSLPSRTALRRWGLPVLALVALATGPTIVASSNTSTTAGHSHFVVAQAAPAVQPISDDRDNQAASRSHNRANCPDGYDCPPPPTTTGTPPPPQQPDRVSVAVQHPPVTPASPTGQPRHSCGPIKHSIYMVQGPCPPKPSKAQVQAIEHQILAQWGWADQFSCLDTIIELEDHWNIYDENSIHAYGLPQAMPGYKMASAGPDWAWNPWTQLKWMLGYIKGTYGTPCHALSVRQSRNPTWY